MPHPATPDPFGHGPPNPSGAAVVYFDHAFSAGHVLDVGVMAAPHRHTQFEINHVLAGEMTYRFDGHRIAVEAGVTAMFFGMVPHQVVACAPGTRFVCLYLPAAVFLSLRLGETLRQALFGGSFVRSAARLDTDSSTFQRWRQDLMRADGRLIAIVHDELGARLRRMEHEGWTDLRDGPPAAGGGPARTLPRSDKVEVMTRFIAGHAGSGPTVDDVARAAGLHPHYAMTLFRKAVGMTITDYLNRNRLDAAQTLLACTDDDIASVAFAAGFGSLSRFYDAFRTRFATSPGAFRRSLRAAAQKRGGPAAG